MTESYSAGVRAGERSRARTMKPFVGIIIRYTGEPLTLLDPAPHTYGTPAPTLDPTQRR